MRKMLGTKFIKWIESLFGVIHQDEANNTTEIGGHLVVDGGFRQNTPTYKDDLAIEYPTGMTKVSGYHTLEEINGVLWFIVAIKFNTSATYTDGSTPVFKVTIPQGYRDSIINIEGKKMSESTSQTDIIVDVGAKLVQGGSIGQTQVRIQNESDKTKLRVTCYATGFDASQTNNELFIRIPIIIL